MSLLTSDLEKPESSPRLDPSRLGLIRWNDQGNEADDEASPPQLWPCLSFQNLQELREILAPYNVLMEKVKARISIALLDWLSKEKGSPSDPVAFLLGDETPQQALVKFFKTNQEPNKILRPFQVGHVAALMHQYNSPAFNQAVMKGLELLPTASLPTQLWTSNQVDVVQVSEQAITSPLELYYRLYFVKVTDAEDQVSYWPGLVFKNFQEMSLTLQQSKRWPHSQWALLRDWLRWTRAHGQANAPVCFLLGQHPPVPCVYQITAGHVVDYQEHLATFHEKYASEAFHQAVSEGIQFLADAIPYMDSAGDQQRQEQRSFLYQPAQDSRPSISPGTALGEEMAESDTASSVQLDAIVPMGESGKCDQVTASSQPGDATSPIPAMEKPAQQPAPSGSPDLSSPTENSALEPASHVEWQGPLQEKAPEKASTLITGSDESPSTLVSVSQGGQVFDTAPAFDGSVASGLPETGSLLETPPGALDTPLTEEQRQSTVEIALCSADEHLRVLSPDTSENLSESTQVSDHSETLAHGLSNPSCKESSSGLDGASSQLPDETGKVPMDAVEERATPLARSVQETDSVSQVSKIGNTSVEDRTHSGKEAHFVEESQGNEDFFTHSTEASSPSVMGENRSALASSQRSERNDMKKRVTMEPSDAQARGLLTRTLSKAKQPEDTDDLSTPSKKRRLSNFPMSGGKSSKAKRSYSTTTAKSPHARERPSVGSKAVATPGTSSKKRGTIERETVKLPAFPSVKRCLEKGGFSFPKSLYCRPGGDPNKNPMALLNEDYFHTLPEFRKHLCSHGLDVDASTWSDDEQEAIRTWVRYAIIRSIPSSSKPATYVKLSALEAGRLLEVLGIQYKKGSLHDSYRLPGIDGKMLPINGPNGIWSYLARMGLPDDCEFNKISQEELLGLELFICEPMDIDVFEKWNPNNQESRSSRRRESQASNSQSSSVSSHSYSVSQRQTKDTKTRSGRRTSHVYKDGMSEHRTDYEKNTPQQPVDSLQNIGQITPGIRTQNRVPRRTLFSPPSNTMGSSSPDNNGQILLPDRDRLRRCIEQLTAATRTLSADENSTFGRNLDTIRRFLNRVITTGGQHGLDEGSPASLYVCGTPGIGKTSGVKWVCNEVLARSDLEFQSTICYIDCSILKGCTTPLSNILEEISCCFTEVKSTTSETGFLRLLTGEDSRKKNRLVVLVLDEIDHMVSERKGGFELKMTSTEAALQRLFQWASDVDIPFAVIGISNVTGGAKYDRLQFLGQFKTITFKPYGEADLTRILEDRIGTIAHPACLRYIAKKVQVANGDARRALDMMCHAVRIRLFNAIEGQISQDPLIELSHVVRGEKEAETGVKEKIRGLPTAGKVAICVLVCLTKANVVSTTVRELRNYVVDCMNQSGLSVELLSTSDFVLTLDTLNDMGLVTLTKPSQKEVYNCSDSEVGGQPICLGYQLEEVAVAVEEELSTTAFYNKLLAQAKIKHAQKHFV